MTPISPHVMAQIARRLAANDRALAECPRHQFEERAIYGPGYPPRWVCARCGGIVDELTYRWYARGRADLTSELEQQRQQQRISPSPSEVDP